MVQGSGGEDGMQLVGEAATQGLSDAINLIPEMQVSIQSLYEDVLRASYARLGLATTRG